MITMKLAGGLGNQLFQYACGRSLANKYNTSLTLDTSFYRHKLWRRSLREVVNLGTALCGQVRIKTTLEQIKRDRRYYDLDKFQLPKDIKLTQQNLPTNRRDHNPFIFDRKIMQAGDNLVYEGYFNSYKYFKDIDLELRTELRLKTGLEAALPPEILKKIVTVNSVSLHVRRGDYITRPEANRYHGTIGLDYYQAAIKIISAKISKPVFFIFSDDPRWCRENILLDQETHFISSLKNYQDLRLMSLCRHHIIANSAFSWWGAWLDPKPGKYVIAPARWLAEKDLKNSDLFPPEWIII